MSTFGYGYSILTTTMLNGSGTGTLNSDIYTVPANCFSIVTGARVTGVGNCSASVANRYNIVGPTATEANGNVSGGAYVPAGESIRVTTSGSGAYTYSVGIVTFKNT